MSDMYVAETILHQLGGPRFRAMTGASGFMGDGNGIQFSVPACKDGISKIRIILEPDDTYTFKAYHIRRRGLVVDVRAEHENVYAEDLQRVFTRATGLATSLGRIPRASEEDDESES